jgi:hypothetical protein
MAAEIGCLPGREDIPVLIPYDNMEIDRGGSGQVDGAAKGAENAVDGGKFQ